MSMVWARKGNWDNITELTENVNKEKFIRWIENNVKQSQGDSTEQPDDSNVSCT